MSLLLAIVLSVPSPAADDPAAQLAEVRPRHGEEGRELVAARKHRRRIIGWGAGLSGVGGLTLVAALWPIPMVTARNCTGSEAPADFCAPRWRWSSTSTITALGGGLIGLAGALVLWFGLPSANEKLARAQSRMSMVPGGLRLRF